MVGLVGLESLALFCRLEPCKHSQVACTEHLEFLAPDAAHNNLSPPELHVHIADIWAQILNFSSLGLRGSGHLACALEMPWLVSSPEQEKEELPHSAH
jgi:hypothetical protein